mmetsp:Transcript_3931/g.9350  ORF Transcript_3931/g.9350 Transcript_3931/m.9350 type:complete len:262 (-) Transcript_3931:155-940(-)
MPALSRSARLGLSACALIGGKAAAYQRGDVLATVVRTQADERRTPWTDLPRAAMPRFRTASTAVVDLPLPSPLPSGGGDSAYLDTAVHASFAFSDNRFVVPWLSLTSPRSGTSHGGGALAELKATSVLQAMQVTFLFSGADVLQVQWVGEYEESAAGAERIAANATGKVGRRFHRVKIRYEWREVAEHDLEGGLVLALLTGLAAAAASICLTCARDEQGKEKGTANSYPNGTSYASTRAHASAARSGRSGFRGGYGGGKYT